MAHDERNLALIREVLVLQQAGPVLEVTVIPHAPENCIAGVRNGSLLVKVTAAPENGKANKAVLEVLADAAGIAPSQMQILRGGRSRHKSIRMPRDFR
jgi:uncharacterized protein (TIGR00251 family)